MNKKFLVQVSISFLVFGLCSFQLLTKPDKEAIYWGGVTSILFYWLPSPKEQTNDKNSAE